MKRDSMRFTTRRSLIRHIKRPRFLSSVYRLTVFDVDHGIDTSTMPMAMFDACSLTVSTFATENATNRAVSIVTFAAGKALNNFLVSSVEAETKNNYTYDSGAGPTTAEAQSGVIDIGARRTRLAQSFTLGLLLVNLALTIGLTYITLVIFRTEGINGTVPLFPVIIVLAIPTLRNLCTGSPLSVIAIGKSKALGSWFGG
jgi:hypothetical protein